MSEYKDNPLPHLGFQRFSPSAQLARYIQSYWFVRSDCLHPVDSNEYLHPDGGMSIIFNYHDSLQFDGGMQVNDCVVDGATTSTRSLNLKGSFDTVGIRFHPAGASHFLSTPLNEFKNTLLSPDDTPFEYQSELYHQLAEVSAYKEKIMFIEKWLFRIFKSEKKPSEVVSASLNLIQHHHGELTIASLSKQLDFNQRKIERLFNTHVGITAKEYARNIRVKHAQNYIKQNTMLSFAEIAHDLGYFDQAHFNHQFKQVIGISPKDYLIKSQIRSRSLKLVAMCR